VKILHNASFATTGDPASGVWPVETLSKDLLSIEGMIWVDENEDAGKDGGESVWYAVLKDDDDCKMGA
jgi:hypothetical protein